MWNNDDEKWTDSNGSHKLVVVLMLLYIAIVLFSQIFYVYACDSVRTIASYT